MSSLYFNTVTDQLKSVLLHLMNEALFDPFILVGGTALSLELGHRMSVDIDLFTDAEYGSIDFKELDAYLKRQFPYVDSLNIEITGMGKSYFLGNSEDDCIKLDLYYTDKFIRDLNLKDGIRLAHLDDIVAMKMDVISRNGRKKDFWDLHELLNRYSFDEMIFLHQLRYPYSHSEEELRDKITDFSFADEDFDPICLKGKQWDYIKLDFLD